MIAGHNEETGTSGINLIQATINNNEVLVKAAIIQDSTKVFRTNDNGSTALTIASYHSNSVIVKLLLENGANPNHINISGR